MPKLTLKKSADALNMGKIERGPELSAGTQPILMWQELQEEVKDDSDEEVCTQPWRRPKLRLRARERRNLWHIEDSAVARAGRADASAASVVYDGFPEPQTATCVLLEEKGGTLLVHAIDERIAFRRPVTYETYTGADAAELFETNKPKIAPAVRRAAMDGGAPPPLIGARVEKGKTARSRLFSRFEHEAAEPAEKPKRARAAGLASRGAPAKGGDDDDEQPGAETSGGHGLGEAGDDRDAGELIDGAGDDGLDFEEGFSDNDGDQGIGAVDPEELGGGDDLKLHSDDEEEEKRAGGADDDEEDDDDDFLEGDVDPLNSPADGAAADRKREHDDAEGESAAPSAKRARADDGARAAQAAEGEAAAQPENHKLTEDEVLKEMRLRGGRVRSQDLLAHFKHKMKRDPQNKERIKTIMKRLVKLIEDPIDGRVLVLKEPYQ